jgi:hypothetical protein
MKKTLLLLLAGALLITACSKKFDSGSGPSLVVPVNPPVPATVTTLAGSGSLGDANSTGALASFNGLNGLGIDALGFIYVADVGNSQIRKVTPLGVVTTFAGDSSGSVNATGTAAAFKSPSGAAVNLTTSNIYIADAGNDAIRMITSQGVVTTVAGNGAPGFANGTGSAATFSSPTAVTVDVAGNIYVADGGNNAIRKITPGGVVTTLAGSGSPGFADGTGTAASFNDPSSVAVDSAGNVYVAEPNNSLIRKVTPAGVVTTFAGNGTRGSANGTGTAASFNTPSGVAVDTKGNVYVADSNNNIIRMITPAGVVTTFAGSGTAGSTNGVGTAASFNYPTALAVSNGYLFVSDQGNNLIRKIGL